MAKNKDKPFSQEHLNNIFKVSTKYPDLLNSRESGWLEFKEKFSLGSLSKYAKTMAAFANAQGGYIVFGIKNKPHKMVGTNEESFNNIDPEQLTKGLNEIFSPEIRWDMNVHEFQDKTFGLIYTHESTNKPVVAKRNSGEVKESEIYYRYRGRSEKVKYSELIAILEERRKQEQLRWMKHLESISRIGVENAAVFDGNTGIVEGTSGRFIVDESVLPKLKFIREGEFSERDGIPTLKLIGEVQAIDASGIQPVQKVYATRTKGIRTDDIVLNFLNQNKVDNPLEYIIQVCWESSANMPIYFYIAQSGKTLAEVVEIIENIKTRSPSQTKLLSRLVSDKDFTNKIRNTGSLAAASKTAHRQSILEKSVDLKEISKDMRQLKYLIQTICTIKAEEIDFDYVLNLLNEIFENYFTEKQFDVSGEIRRSICYVDALMNKGGITQG